MNFVLDAFYCFLSSDNMTKDAVWNCGCRVDQRGLGCNIADHLEE